MPTNFLDSAGTNGFIATPFNLLSTELNAITSGSAFTSSAGGTSGVFTQTNTANAMWGSLYFTTGTAGVTPTTGGLIAIWFLLSPDGGTTFETPKATPSSSVSALSRSPDAVITFDAATYSSGNIAWCQGRVIRLPWESFKVFGQNLTGTTLAASGNLIKVGPVATQY
jgi:hypothetical protein